MKKRSVAKVKMVPPKMVMVDLESIKNLKEWSLVSYVLTLIGGIFIGGIFLFSQSGIEIALPVASVALGSIMVILGVLIEWKKLGSTVKNMEESTVDAGTLYYTGDTIATEEDYKPREETQ